MNINKNLKDMDQTKIKKVFDAVKAPSNKTLNKNQRIGLVAGGLTMAVLGNRKFGKKGWLLSLLGGGLTYIGLSGKNPLYALNKRSSETLKVRDKIVINSDRSRVYEFWRKLTNLAVFMDHIKEIKEVSDKRSKWKANLNGVDLEWEAEITDESKDNRIAWRSLSVSEVQNHGHVEFKDTPDFTGTEIIVELEYGSDAGQLAKAFASVYHPVFEKQLHKELLECKKILETEKISQLQPDIKNM